MKPDCAIGRIDQNKSLSYGQLRTVSDGLAAYLEAEGDLEG